ncbi:MAG: glycosyltransferase family 4 protein [Gammaproteobacteria bacterium]|nr:glycosyltransferase family 4 protein [Gammaproteobacteria bacterium]MDH5651854.1 glycosyltransferase family 4 protein [Gammaproteobacteria bacterium]
MNIIELCTSKGWGGLELYAWQVSKWLKANGHACHAVIVPGSLIARRLAESGVDTTIIKPKFRPLPLLAARRLAKLIDQLEADILHVHWTRDLILAALAKRFARRPVKLVFIRHMALTRHKRDFYHRFIYQSIDRFLVITKKLYEEARQFLPMPEQRLQLLYHGVADFEPVNVQHCQQFFATHKLADAKFRVLLPGRIEHYKGQHTLVEAVIKLHQQGLDLDLVILGHIMDEAYFEGLQQQIQAAGLAQKIHYLGFVDQPTLVYGCFDVVVLTTYAETFGLVLVEAMKSEVAVIGTNAGGVPEIIEHGKTGLLYEPGNADDLAQCVKQLIADPAMRRQLARAGKAYADRMFSEQAHYTSLMNIFSELVKE